MIAWLAYDGSEMTEALRTPNPDPGKTLCLDRVSICPDCTFLDVTPAVAGMPADRQVPVLERSLPSETAYETRLQEAVSLDW